MLQEVSININNKREVILNQIHRHNYYTLKEYCKNQTILDIGCGSGEGCALLCSFGATKVVGVDLNVAYIEKAQEYFENNNINFLVGNVEQINNLFDNETFDIIIIHDTLEYIVDKINCLTNAKKLLAPNGVCVISRINIQNIDNGLINFESYTNTEFIDNVRTVFGDNVRVFKSYPAYGIVHSEANNYQIEIAEKLDNQNSLAVTAIYDVSNKIQASSYFNVVNIQTWENFIAHDYAMEIKKERLIFELQQRAILTQGLIIENQLLKERLKSRKLKNFIYSFGTTILNKLKFNKISNISS